MIAYMEEHEAIYQGKQLSNAKGKAANSGDEGSRAKSSNNVAAISKEANDGLTEMADENENGTSSTYTHSHDICKCEQWMLLSTTILVG